MSQNSKAGLQIRAIVSAVAVIAALAVGGGDIFGGPPSYVEADSTAFATALLDVSRADWTAESDVRFSVEATAAAPTPAFMVPQDANDDEPVEVTKGGATVCPASYTLCPQVPTKCELTKCPRFKTKCPIAVTQCPQATTQCPTVPTKCEETVCPKDPTFCPVESTKCEETTCPKSATMCPVVATKCEFTVCPKTTVCGDQKTFCYGLGIPFCPIEVDDRLALPASTTARVNPRKPARQPARRPLSITFVPKSL